MAKVLTYFLYFSVNIANVFLNDYTCYDFKLQPRVCLPGAENILTGRQLVVTANRTCGNPPSRYCRTANPSGCYACNSTNQHSSSKLSDLDYPKANWNKYKPSWWQSITWFDALQRGLLSNGTLKVNLTLSMNKSYDLSGSIKILFYSSLPKAFVIEKSIDHGKTWVPLRYYSTDCVNFYHHVKLSKDVSDKNAVYCEQLENNVVPIQGEEIIFKPSYSVKTYFETNMQAYLKATNIRLVLDYPWTDGNEKTGEEVSFNKYYYDIADLKIFARCRCNGHAPHCMGAIDGQVCDCKHNTAGIDCEKCLPLFNNKPWRAANSSTTPNPCEACECNDHSTSCSFNASLNHGVCENCKDGTDGYFCEKCDRYHYRNHSLPISEKYACIECDCHFPGTLSNGSCSNDIENAGECLCKDHVVGARCENCRPDYYGLEIYKECFGCNCSMYGTVNGSTSCDKESGNCSCKPNIIGRKCSQCKAGFHTFPTSVIDDCQACNCDVGGSLTMLCDTHTGMCACRNGITGLNCDSVLANNYVPFMDSVIVEAEDGLPDEEIFVFQQNFTGLGYKLLHSNSSLEFVLKPPVSYWYFITIRYHMNTITNNIPLTLSHNNTSVNTHTNISLYASNTYFTLPKPMYLYHNTSYLFYLHNASPFQVNVDSLVFLPDIKQLKTFDQSGVDKEDLVSCWNQYKSPQKHISDDVCLKNGFSMSAEFFNQSFACNCNMIGSLNETCDPIGGYCYCKYGVTGRTCNQCALGFFNFTNSGCQACECNITGSTNVICSRQTGECPCKNNVIQRTCSQCSLNHYGFSNGTGCQPCLCNGIGSLSQQCADDGQCDCKHNIHGKQCSSCVENHYNFSSAGCTACMCNKAGSMTLQCDEESGVCLCKKNVMGDKCDTCKPNFHNLHKSNKYGCKECFCFNKTTTCHSSSFNQTHPEDFADASGNVLRIVLPNPQKTVAITSNLKGNLLYLLYETLYLSVYFHHDNSLSDGNSVNFIVTSKNKVSLTISKTNIPPNENVTLSFEIDEDTLNERYPLWQIQGILGDASQMKFELVGRNADYVLLYGGLLPDDDSMLNMKTEICQCSANYTGTSCEKCAQGFTRETPNANQFGRCVKCECNGRSNTCNPDTGVCENCRYGTTGDFCEKCYPNIIGNECSHCAFGYFGYNMSDFEGCRSCSCEKGNTVTQNASICDVITGQCPCKPGISGRTCDRCSENSVNVSRVCQTCPPCFGLIQDEVHSLRKAIFNFKSLLQNTSSYIVVRDATSANQIQLLNNAVGKLVKRAQVASEQEKSVMRDLLTVNETLLNVQNIVDLNISSAINKFTGGVVLQVTLNSSINATANTIQYIYAYLWANIFMLENELSISNTSIHEKLDVLQTIHNNMSNFHSNYFETFLPFSNRLVVLNNQSNHLVNQTFLFHNKSENIEQTLNISKAQLKDIRGSLNNTEILFVRLYRDSVTLFNLSNILLRNINKTMSFHMSNVSAQSEEVMTRFNAMKSDVEKMNQSLIELRIQARTTISRSNLLINLSRDNLTSFMEDIKTNEILANNISQKWPNVSDAILGVLNINKTLSRMTTVLQSFRENSLNTSKEIKQSLSQIEKLGFTHNATLFNLTKLETFVNDALRNTSSTASLLNHAFNITIATSELVDELLVNLTRLFNLSSSLLHVTTNQSSLMMNITNFTSNMLRDSELCRNISDVIKTEAERAENLLISSNKTEIREKSINEKLKKLLKSNENSTLLSASTFNKLKENLNSSKRLRDALNLTDALAELRLSRDRQSVVLTEKYDEIKSLRNEISQLSKLFDILKKRKKCD